MFILKKVHQPGVYVPLRALFLVIQCTCISYHINLVEYMFLIINHFVCFLVIQHTRSFFHIHLIHL